MDSCRTKIVLVTAEENCTAEIMRATGKAKKVNWRWQEHFDEGTLGRGGRGRGRVGGG